MSSILARGRLITESVKPPPHLVLVDGSGFIFRAFHALPPMTDPRGVPVNAVFGFTNMLVKLLRDHAGTHLAVIFDAGSQTFRNRLYDGYKAQRPPPPEDLIPQFALVREATAAFGVPAIELADWEADDLIASYVRCVVEAGGRATVVSSDKDLMQLIRPGVVMQDPIKAKMIGPDEVMEKFGVPPDKLIEAQALMGDAVDNVPGVPGIGPKTAALLISEFGDLEGVLAAAPSMKPGKRRDLLLEHAGAARLSRELVILRDDVALPEPLTALATREPDPVVLGAWLTRMGFASTRRRLGLGDAQGEAADAVMPQNEGAVAPAPAGEAGYGPYATLCDAGALAEWIAAARAQGMVALVPRADVAEGRRARLLGIGLALAPGRAAYVPLGHVGDLADGRPVQLEADAVLEALGPLLADASVLKIMHDAKFAQGLLGVAITPADDVQLMAYALEAGAHGFGLEELSALHLGHDAIAHDEVTGAGRARLAYEAVPVERASAHMGELADITWRLWRLLRPRLRTEGALTLYEQVDRPLVAVLLAAERAGIAVDETELRRLSADFAQRMAVMEAEIHRLADASFNLGSPKQLGEVLFERLGLPGGKRMKTGAWGTDAQVLQSLADEGHEIPALVLEWRQLAKLKSTYADALVSEIDHGTGRVHTRYAMAATTTGRLSSVDPNLQNIPIRTEEGGRIRRAFIAASGMRLISADYSQIELRLLAHQADIPALRDSFARGEDIHARTASEVFGVPMAQMDAATRRRAKAINFGIIYGISAFGLARQLGIGGGEAKIYIEAYFTRYPGIRGYMDATREFARAHGYVLTPFGRRCYVPGIGDRNPARRAYAERQAINAPLQGGAADIIKRAMVRLPGALAAAGLSARLLLQVHDELLLEAPEDEAEATAAVARRVMQGAAVLAVPLVVDTGIGASWAEAH
jgi:DNA polymerase-1